MLGYTVKSNRDTQVVVDGLGIFAPDETKTFTEGDVETFRENFGLQLNQGNLPDGLELTVAILRREVN